MKIATFNVNGIIGRLNSLLAWFQRLIEHARGLWKSGHPVVLAGDFNVVPTDFDIYNTRSWKKDALLQPESRAAYQQLLAQGWMDALRFKHPEEPIYTFWDYFRNHWQTNSSAADRSSAAECVAPVCPGRCQCRQVGERATARK